MMLFIAAEKRIHAQFRCSIDYRYMKKQKLQTYRSFNNLYGETFIVYNPDFQTLKVNEVYTIMADSKKNPSPANAFNEVLPGFAANAPAITSCAKW